MKETTEFVGGPQDGDVMPCDPAMNSRLRRDGGQYVYDPKRRAYIWHPD